MLLREAITFAILTTFIARSRAFPNPFLQREQSTSSGPLTTAPAEPPPISIPAIAHTEISVPGLTSAIGAIPVTAHVESTVEGVAPPSTETQSTGILSTVMPKAHTEVSESDIGQTTIVAPYAHSEIPVTALTANPANPSQEGGGNNNPSQNGGNNNNNNNANPTQGGGDNGPTQGGNVAPTAPGQNAPNPQPTSGSDLLNVIASQIYNEPAPPAGTAAQSGGNTNNNNNNNNNNSPQALQTGPQQQGQPAQTGTGAQQQVQATGAQASAAGAMQTVTGLLPGASGTQAQVLPQTAPAQVTIGTNALTLTNGLSTVLGSGSSTTLVELTTNSAGQTVIIVGPSTSTVLSTASSSGANGAIGTNEAGASTAAATTHTSKKGAAVSIRWVWGLEAWIGISVCLFGLVVVL